MKKEKWQLLTASSRALIPSRWKTLWNYVIRGRPIEYTLSAWVTFNKYICDLKLYIKYPKK
jgi:hypothetical protein